MPGSGETSQQRRSTQMLKQWLDAHRDNPYPSPPEKEALQRGTGLSRLQIDAWFTNARQRYVRPKERRGANPDYCRYTPDVRAILVRWLVDPAHRENPYPKQEDLQLLMNETQLTKRQVQNWFTNARKRKLADRLQRGATALGVAADMVAIAGSQPAAASTGNGKGQGKPRRQQRKKHFEQEHDEDEGGGDEQHRGQPEEQHQHQQPKGSGQMYGPMGELAVGALMPWSVRSGNGGFSFSPLNALSGVTPQALASAQGRRAFTFDNTTQHTGSPPGVQVSEGRARISGGYEIPTQHVAADQQQRLAELQWRQNAAAMAQRQHIEQQQYHQQLQLMSAAARQHHLQQMYHFQQQQHEHHAYQQQQQQAYHQPPPPPQLQQPHPRSQHQPQQPPQKQPQQQPQQHHSQPQEQHQPQDMRPRRSKKPSLHVDTASDDGNDIGGDGNKDQMISRPSLTPTEAESSVAGAFEMLSHSPLHANGSGHGPHGFAQHTLPPSTTNASAMAAAAAAAFAASNGFAGLGLGVFPPSPSVLQQSMTPVAMARPHSQEEQTQQHQQNSSGGGTGGSTTTSASAATSPFWSNNSSSAHAWMSPMSASDAQQQQQQQQQQHVVQPQAEPEAVRSPAQPGGNDDEPSAVAARQGVSEKKRARPSSSSSSSASSPSSHKKAARKSGDDGDGLREAASVMLGLAA